MIHNMMVDAEQKDLTAHVNVIAHAVGLSTKTTSKIMSLLDDHELRVVQEMVTSKHSGKKRTFGVDVEIALLVLVSKNPTLALVDVMNELAKRDPPISISVSTISRILKRMEWTKKRLRHDPERRNDDDVITQRREVALELLRVHRKRIVFLDETGANLRTVPLYGWSKKGVPASIVVPSAPGRNVTLLAAIHCEGVLAYDVFDGATNVQNFLKFCRMKLIPKCKTKFMRGARAEKPILLMDNLAVHKHDDVVAALSQVFHVVFNAPYSPQMNAIENVFKHFKDEIRRQMEFGHHPPAAGAVTVGESDGEDGDGDEGEGDSEQQGDMHEGEEESSSGSREAVQRQRDHRRQKGVLH